MTMNYDTFLDLKTHYGAEHGFNPVWMPPILKDFQEALTVWALRKGRGALFADCGMGKTFMLLVWAENIARMTDKRVLILVPLAVAFQTVLEGIKVGVEVIHRRTGIQPGDRIVVTNYERLHYFNPEDFAGVVCDESSILKNFDGAMRAEITDFMRKRPYRLLCTATAAPNDYIELGTSSEALGELGATDMLSRFFKKVEKTMSRRQEHMNDIYRFRGHAEQDFWRWVVSWARALRKPSDMDFPDDGFTLPPLTVRQHIVKAAKPRNGMLFDIPAVGLEEQRADLRNTINERCEMAAQLINAHNRPAVAWCNLNAEGDLLEKLIPGSIQVKGSDSEEYKELAAQWFVGQKCLCQNPLFSDKISSWQKLAKKNANTTERIIIPINPNGENVLQKSKPSTTTTGGKDMPLMKEQEQKLEKTPEIGKEITQTNDLHNGSSRMELPPMNINECLINKTEDVLSADQQIRETFERPDCMLTTITPQGKSEDYCAQDAISLLDNFKTTQKDLSVPQCICGHESGRRVIITKATIFGMGMNFQHCAHETFFPSHSYEQYYQAVRRCWRFGQKSEVIVDMVTTDGQDNVLKNLNKKAEKANEMFDYLVSLMRNELILEKRKPFTQNVVIPDWL